MTPPSDRQRRITRLWETAERGGPIVVVYSEVGREISVPKAFRDRRLAVGHLIDDDLVIEIGTAVTAWQVKVTERRTARKAATAAKAKSEGTITALSAKERIVFIHLDGAYSLAVTPGVVEARGLHVGQVLSADQVTSLKSAWDAAKVVDSIDRLLNYRPRTEAEIRERFASKTVDPASLERAIEARRGYGMIMDDESFALWFANSRGVRKGKGFRAIVGDLRHLGVNPEAIEAAGAVYAGDDAIGRAADRAARGCDLATQKGRDRFINRLASRGFGWSEINQVITARTGDGEESLVDE